MTAVDTEDAALGANTVRDFGSERPATRRMLRESERHLPAAPTIKGRGGIRSARRPALLVVVVVAAIVGGLVWHFPPPPRVARGSGFGVVHESATPDGPVEILRGRAALAWQSGTRATVNVGVRNRGSEPATATVWWLLAGADDARPWVAPIASSEVATVTLASGTSQTINLVGMAPKTAGTYSLSLWVHYLQPGGFTHSDGATFNDLVTVR